MGVPMKISKSSSIGTPRIRVGSRIHPPGKADEILSGMGKEAPAPKLAQLYEKLSAEQQASLSKAVTEKLQGIIGGYGELSVLVEYISVMLQSSRPPETIQAELEAFLQDKSGPFTSWLCEKLAKIVEGGSKRKREKDGGEKKAKKDANLLPSSLMRFEVVVLAIRHEATFTSHPDILPDLLPPCHRSPQLPRRRWRVARGNTVVRKSEKLDSEEVQKLQEGEIVEQVAPAFTTENGIIRVQIRHPSSPLFPKPIGWVTQDASAAGGPKFLEPGPEPMKQPWASSGSAWAPPWRPRGVPPPRPAYAKSFQNLTWTPS
ncbi:unnamed protein product [Effrenium voratum]|nr:unnamed protein product [Effrenium voratum]